METAQGALTVPLPDFALVRSSGGLNPQALFIKFRIRDGDEDPEILIS